MSDTTERLRNLEAQMSNLCWNLGRGHTFSDRERTIAKSLATDWDKASRDYRAALQAPAVPAAAESSLDPAALLERVAQLQAHRACCGSEHDPENGKLHGCCVVCGIPWPCEYAGTPPEAFLADPKDSTA